MILLPDHGIILVSACLTGRPCRYDGRRAPSRPLLEMLSGRRWAAVCPEQLGGLPTPRPSARLVGGDGADVLAGRGRLVNSQDEDVTAQFVRGARLTLEIARRLGVSVCCLKDRSPSCGLTPGIDKQGRRRGRGVTAAILLEAGLDVVEICVKSSG